MNTYYMRWGKKFFVLLITLLFSMGIVHAYPFFMEFDSSLHANVMDDSPSGTTIVDVGIMNGYSHYALSESGEVWTWGDNATGELGQGIIGGGRTIIPQRVVNAEDATDGNPYLSNIIKVWGSDYVGAGSGCAFALASDGTLYAWGDNSEGVLGLPEKISYSKPVKVDVESLGLNNVEILDIVSSPKNITATYIITKNTITKKQEVYVIGHSTNGVLCLGNTTSTDSFVKIQEDNLGMELPDIKDVVMGYGTSVSLLSTDGYIYECGSSKYRGTMNSKTDTKPTKAVISDGSPLTGVQRIISKPMNNAIIEKNNGDLYISSTLDATTTASRLAYSLFSKYTDASWSGLQDEFKNIKGRLNTGGGEIFLGNDNKLYKTVGYGYQGIKDKTTKISFTPYIQGDISDDYRNAKKAIGGYGKNANIVLSNTGAVYFEGKKLGFGNISIKGTKADGSIYTKGEKYNGDVNLAIAVNTYTMDKVRYEIDDEAGVNTTTGTVSFAVPNDGTRLRKKITFYIDGAKSTTTTTFNIDLFKKTPTLTDISNNGIYKPNKTISFGYNGYSDNTISATLSKDGQAALPYTSGSEIKESGNYVLQIVDQYGNENQYNFMISDQPIAQDVIFTAKNANGLVFDNAITKANAQIGTLSLQYAEDDPTFEIASISVGSDLDGDRFTINDNNKLMVKETALSAGTYTIPISGKDTNNMPFSATITITIEKAAQSLTWNDASKSLQSDGLEVGKETTLGVIGLENPTVTYSLKSENSCITYDSSNGSIKATCVPNAPVVFIATAEETTNYQSQSIELQFRIKKKEITLSVEFQSLDAYGDSATISIGDELPSMRIKSEDTSIDIEALGTPEYQFTKNETTVSDPTLQAGTYHVSANYPSDSGADMYQITWKEATLIVENITIDDSNIDSFFTMTSNGEPYTQNTWTKHPVIITPKHDKFNIMEVGDSGNKSNSPYTYDIEGTQTIPLHFYSVSGAKVSSEIMIKIDKTAPAGVTFIYTEEDTLRSFLRTITFHRYFSKAQKVSFQSTDEGSGVQHYRYEIIELNEDMSELTFSKQSGILQEDEALHLLINKSYRISAWAVDNVGNESSEKIERVYLSDAQAQLLITAKSGDTLYDETSWCKEAIQVKLSTTSIAGTEKYQYSLDEETFIDLVGDEITLPSPLSNQNNTLVTFRAIHNDGTQSDNTLHLKIDTTKPQFEIQGKVNDAPYDGGVAQSDITLVPSQTIENISGVTYYYINDGTKKDTEPTTANGWKAYQGTLLHTTNGTTTYYFKAVSGAGIVSDVEEMTVQLAKKIYTPIQVTVTSNGDAYTSGTWANHDLTFTLSEGIEDENLITGYQVAINDGSVPNETTTWESVNGTTHTLTNNQKNKSVWFRVLPLDPNGSVSSAIPINLDVDTPSVPQITMEEIHTSFFAECINFLSMGNWMNKEMKTSIHAEDATSGIKDYEIVLSEDGNTTTQRSEDGILTFGNETNLTLKAKACDLAGNCSAYSEQSAVHIDMDKPLITGVKDASKYRQYYLPRVFEVTDEVSGLKEATYQFNDEAPIDITNATEKTMVREKGTYRIHAFDEAGNEVLLTFTIVPLPDIASNIDGSDESKAIIDQIKQEYEGVKADIDPTETSEFTEWIKEAEDVWEEKRSKVIETEDKTSRIEAQGDVSFDPSVKLYVEAFAESELPYLPKKTIGQYHVQLKKGEVTIQPSGAIDVYLPYAESEEPIVYQIDEHKHATLITGTKVGNFVKFTTTTLYDYAITNSAQENNKQHVCVVGPDSVDQSGDDVCGTENEQGDEAIKKPDGSVEVPSGGSVLFPDGSVVEAPDGAIIQPDGTVQFPDGSEYNPDGSIKDEQIQPEDAEAYFRVKQGTLGNHDWYTSAIILEATGKNGFDQIGLTADQFHNELTIQEEGEYTITFYLKKSSNSVKSSPITYHVKIDHTAPILSDFIYQAESNLRSLARILTFDHFFHEAKELSFAGSDEHSGIEHYRYEIVELKVDGSEYEDTRQSGIVSDDSITLSLEHQYKIQAWAVDMAGNESAIGVEYVYLSEEVGELDILATSNGLAYDGSGWSAYPIEYQLSTTNVSGAKTYQYALDGSTFIDMEGSSITLPNPVTNQNNIPITFRVIHQDGTTSDKVMYAKIDTTQPDIEIEASVKDQPYDGSKVDEDITITLDQTNENISPVTYYYTTDEHIKDRKPSVANGWSIYKDSILHQTNGTYTYYFTAVSDAGKISDMKTLEVQLAKKVYTPIQMITTSENRPYTGGSWVKHDVTFELSGGIQEADEILGYEYTFTDGSTPTDSTKWESIDGTTVSFEESIQGETIWFRVLPLDPKQTIYKGIKVMLDVDAPSVPVLSLKEKNTSLIANFIRKISFGNWMTKEAEVTMLSDDTDSGIAYYEYEEHTSSGTSTKQTTNGSVLYRDGSEVRIQARACDRAGNCSSFSDSEQVLIDMQAPTISGVKDQNVYKQYFLPRFVKASDVGSGIKEAYYTTSNGARTDMQRDADTRIEGEGNYSIYASDIAGNETQLSFVIALLPDIDTEIDGSDESKAIIEQVRKEFDENKSKFDKTETDEYLKWIDKATEQWKKQRVPRIEDDQTGTFVEGQDNLTFDPKTELVVEKVNEEIPLLPRKAIAIYDVYLKKGNTIIQPDGSIKVSLPYHEEKPPIVYEIDENGKVSEIPCVYADGYVSFITSRLKRYAISNTAQDIITPPDENTDKNECKLEGKDINIDTDGDTLPDINVDIDKDCVSDINIDINLDKVPDIDIDSVGDGKPNINVDVTGDGKADINILLYLKWKPNVTYTVNGVTYNSMKDLQPDLNVDDDGDGTPDRNVDTTGDGLPNVNVDEDWFEKHNMKKPDASTSVQGSYQTNVGGAETGDKTKWVVWFAMMIFTIGTMVYKYRKMKKA